MTPTEEANLARVTAGCWAVRAAMGLCQRCGYAVCRCGDAHFDSDSLVGGLAFDHGVKALQHSRDFEDGGDHLFVLCSRDSGCVFCDTVRPTTLFRTLYRRGDEWLTLPSEDA